MDSYHDRTCQVCGVGYDFAAPGTRYKSCSAVCAKAKATEQTKRWVSGHPEIYREHSKRRYRERRSVELATIKT